jgi:ribosomal protein L9
MTTFYLQPNRALELLTAMIPETIIFERRLKHIPSSIGIGSKAKPAPSDEAEQNKLLTPLERRRARMLEAQKALEPEKTPEEAEAERKMMEEEEERERKRAEKEAEKFKEIYGSVSMRDVATFIKDKMLLDPEASRVHVQPEEITLLGLGEGVDKVEKVGRYEIEIRAHVGRDKVEPVRRTLEVVAA